MELLVSLLYWCMPEKTHLKKITNAMLVFDCIVYFILIYLGCYYCWLGILGAVILGGVNSWVYHYTNPEEDYEDDEKNTEEDTEESEEQD